MVTTKFLPLPVSPSTKPQVQAWLKALLTHSFDYNCYNHGISVYTELGTKASALAQTAAPPVSLSSQTSLSLDANGQFYQR